jgi:hypothetical protein
MVRLWWVGNGGVGERGVCVCGFALHSNIIKVNMIRFQSLIFLITPIFHGLLLTQNERIMRLLAVILAGSTTASNWAVVTWITPALLTG